MKTIIIQNTIELLSDKQLLDLLKSGFEPKQTEKEIRYLIK